MWFVWLLGSLGRGHRSAGLSQTLLVLPGRDRTELVHDATRPRGDQATDNHVLLQAVQGILLPGRRGFRQDTCRLLEGCGRDEDCVWSDALVMPCSTGMATAGRSPMFSRLVFSSSYSMRSTVSPIR